MHHQPERGRDKIPVQIDSSLEAIVPGFLANRQRDLITIESCLKQGDLQTIRLLGHRMKGDGGGYGFDQISVIGDRLEQAAMAHNLSALHDQLKGLKDFLARVEIVYIH
ncbi:MAG: Hpt domain-containing protein [Nitrospira sp.]|nr:Hpt domain-containing protein [Nitrospira sp.]